MQVKAEYHNFDGFFKSKRGGQNQTPKKDIPHYLKDQEIRTRKREGNTKKAELPPQEIEETEYSIEGGGFQESRKKVKEVKEVETIIFILNATIKYLDRNDNKIANINCKVYNLGVKIAHIKDHHNKAEEKKANNKIKMDSKYFYKYCQGGF